MAKFIRKELQLDHYFDPVKSRHYLNGELAVLHCHHYMSLYSQLADDISFVDGKKLMSGVTEETIYRVLKEYYCNNNITELRDKIMVAQEYYSVIGMGKMRILHVGEDSGSIELTHSHVDEGWIKKWGKREQPVNFFTWGYISAVFALLTGRNIGSYKVTEETSIVSGAPSSLFKAAII